MGLTNIAENGGRGLTGPAGADGAPGPDIAGLTSDELTPAGVVVAGRLAAGQAQLGPTDAASMDPATININGRVVINDTAWLNNDGDPNLYVSQSRAVQSTDTAVGAASFVRQGGVIDGDYFAPTVEVIDSTASTQPPLRVTKQGTAVLELSTRKSITGALASVTDANAKAVLTSIIAALTGIKVANDNTT